MKYISADYIKAIVKSDRLMQGNCEYELWKQEVDKKVDAMPSIEVMDIVTAYQQGWCDALDASISALNDAKFQLGKADRKTENSSEKPNNCEPQTDCGDFADRLAYERGVKHAWEVAQKVFDSTLTFYEAEDLAKQIDKDINVRSKDEPQTIKVGMATDSVTGKVLGITADTDCAWK